MEIKSDNEKFSLFKNKAVKESNYSVDEVSLCSNSIISSVRFDKLANSGQKKNTRSIILANVVRFDKKFFEFDK